MDAGSASGTGSRTQAGGVGVPTSLHGSLDNAPRLQIRTESSQIWRAEPSWAEPSRVSRACAHVAYDTAWLRRTRITAFDSSPSIEYNVLLRLQVHRSPTAIDHPSFLLNTNASLVKLLAILSQRLCITVFTICFVNCYMLLHSS